MVLVVGRIGKTKKKREKSKCTPLRPAFISVSIVLLREEARFGESRRKHLRPATRVPSYYTEIAIIRDIRSNHRRGRPGFAGRVESHYREMDVAPPVKVNIFRRPDPLTRDEREERRNDRERARRRKKD